MVNHELKRNEESKKTGLGGYGENLAYKANERSKKNWGAIDTIGRKNFHRPHFRKLLGQGTVIYTPTRYSKTPLADYVQLRTSVYDMPCLDFKHGLSFLDTTPMPIAALFPLGFLEISEDVSRHKKQGKLKTMHSSELKQWIADPLFTGRTHDRAIQYIEEEKIHENGKDYVSNSVKRVHNNAIYIVVNDATNRFIKNPVMEFHNSKFYAYEEYWKEKGVVGKRKARISHIKGKESIYIIPIYQILNIVGCSEHYIPATSPEILV